MPFNIGEIYVGQVISGEMLLENTRVETINPAPIAQTPTYNPPVTQAPIPMTLPKKPVMNDGMPAPQEPAPIFAIPVPPETTSRPVPLPSRPDSSSGQVQYDRVPYDQTKEEDLDAEWNSGVEIRLPSPNTGRVYDNHYGVFQSETEYMAVLRQNADAVKKAPCVKSIVEAWENSGLKNNFQGWTISVKLEKDDPISMSSQGSSSASKSGTSSTFSLPKETGDNLQEEVTMNVMAYLGSIDETLNFANAVTKAIGSLEDAYNMTRLLSYGAREFLAIERLRQKAMADIMTAMNTRPTFNIVEGESGVDLTSSNTKNRMRAWEFVMGKLETMLQDLECEESMDCPTPAVRPQDCPYGAEVIRSSGSPCWTPLEWECYEPSY